MSVAQFWGGRAKTLEKQAAGPISNPKEMALTHALAIDVLRSISQYRSDFADIYAIQEITLDQVTNAIAAFEETLVTPDSRSTVGSKGMKTR